MGRKLACKCGQWKPRGYRTREVIAASDLESWVQLSETTTTFFCYIKQMLNCKSPFRLNSLKKSSSSAN